MLFEHTDFQVYLIKHHFLLWITTFPQEKKNYFWMTLSGLLNLIFKRLQPKMEFHNSTDYAHQQILASCGPALRMETLSFSVNRTIYKWIRDILIQVGQKTQTALLNELHDLFSYIFPSCKMSEFGCQDFQPPSIFISEWMDRLGYIL